MPDPKTPRSDLPISRSASPAPRSEFRIPRSSPPVPRSRVLLVDDEESIRITLAEFIKEDGYVIDIAEDAAEALGLMDKHAFDVVVTDIVLPRMNGVALMKEICARSPDTQVILLTGDPTVETAAEAVRAGAVDYLTKPVSKNAIRRVVANAAHVKTLTDEKRKLEESNQWYQHHLEELVEKRTTALRESEVKYRSTFESTGTAMAMIEEDTTLSMVNGQFEKLCGYSREELEGKKSWTDFVVKEDLECMKTYHDARRAEGGNAPESYEFRLVTREGEIKNILLTINMIPGTKRSIASLSDITKLKQMDKALRESESRYRGIVQYQTECIDRWLPDGTITFVNDAYCRYYDRPREELVGSKWIQLVPPVDRQRVWEYVERLKATLTPENPTATTEHRETAAGGEIRWMHWSEQTIFDEQGNLIELQSVGRDITQRKQAEEALRNHYVNLAETMARTFNLRDPYVAAHQLGAARLVQLVGERLGWEERRLQTLYIGALLHDIGKVAIPEAILRKPGKLAEEEWALVRTHPKRGYELLNEANLPWPVAELAHHHHERLDGTGYPDGLTGDQLCEEVRILAVCNVADAMSRPNPHRTARSKEEIVDELQRGKGGEYDPKVVSVLLELIESGELIG